MAKTSTKVFILVSDGPPRRMDRRRRRHGLDGGHPIADPRAVPRPSTKVSFSPGRAMVKVRLLHRGRVRRRHWDGRVPPADQGLRSAFSHAQLGGVAPVIAAMVKGRSASEFHWGVADYLHAARHIASKTDVARPMPPAGPRWNWR